MNQEARRVATVIGIYAGGAVLWFLAHPTLSTVAIHCWVLAVLYAILTSPRRFL